MFGDVFNEVESLRLSGVGISPFFSRLERPTDTTNLLYYLCRVGRVSKRTCRRVVYNQRKKGFPLKINFYDLTGAPK